MPHCILLNIATHTSQNHDMLGDTKLSDITEHNNVVNTGRKTVKTLDERLNTPDGDMLATTTNMTSFSHILRNS